MAKKTLPGMDTAQQEQKGSSLLDRAARQEKKRLVFDVTAEEHAAFMRESVDAGLKANAYFKKMWEAYRG